MERLPKRLEELAQIEDNNLILCQTTASSLDLSSNTLEFLSCQILHDIAKQQHLHSRLAFFLTPMNCHSIPIKSCHELGKAPIIPSSSPTLFHM
ncbi:hypothetical protein LguiB_002591 [Lonicera macranthoides]